MASPLYPEATSSPSPNSPLMIKNLRRNWLGTVISVLFLGAPAICLIAVSMAELFIGKNLYVQGEDSSWMGKSWDRIKERPLEVMFAGLGVVFLVYETVLFIKPAIQTKNFLWIDSNEEDERQATFKVRTKVSSITWLSIVVNVFMVASMTIPFLSLHFPQWIKWTTIVMENIVILGLALVLLGWNTLVIRQLKKDHASLATYQRLPWVIRLTSPFVPADNGKRIKNLAPK